MIRALLLILCLAWIAPLSGSEAPKDSHSSLSEVIVKGKRIQVTDEELTVRMEKAIEADPFIDTDHLTVTIKDGIVYLEGSVYEDIDLFRLLRTARRIPGVRRIVNNLAMDGFGGAE